VVREGDDVLLVGTGFTVGTALGAADVLAAQGISATVLDAYSLKPFDADTVAELAARHRAVVAVEEHNTEGGLGTLVVEAVYAGGVSTPVFKQGVPDEFALIGPPSHLYRYYGIDPDGIATVAQRALEEGRRPLRPLWTEQDRQAVLDRYAA